VGGDAVVVISCTSSGLAKERGARQKVLKIATESRRAGEEDETVISPRGAASQRDPVRLPAKTELVRLVRPAHGVEPNEIIRQCRLQLRGIGAKRPAAKLQAVHVRVAQGTLG